MKKIMLTLSLMMVILLTACEMIEEEHYQINHDDYALLIREVSLQEETLFDEHPEGMQLLTISITITNELDSEVTLTPSLQFYLEDEFQNVHDIDPFVTVEEPLLRTLMPCEPVEGDLAFYVPVDAITYTLIFEPSINEPRQLRIPFNLESFLND